MRALVYGTGAVTLAVMIAIAPADKAKADGGVTAAIIGGYLLADYLVGRRCGYGRGYWPFNIVQKVGRRKACKYRRKNYVWWWDHSRKRK